MRPPFARTVCACATCTQCCQDQPGHLLPGELEQIAAHLGETVEAARVHFWASPGALVQAAGSGRTFRIGTITPRYDRRRKRCVFLGDDDRCRIHAVAPFGCAYFDTHQDAREGQRRSAWGLQVIQADPGYAAERAALPFAESYKPRGY